MTESLRTDPASMAPLEEPQAVHARDASSCSSCHALHTDVERLKAEYERLRREHEAAHAALNEIGAPQDDGGGVLSLCGRCWALSSRWAAEQKAAEADLATLRSSLLNIEQEMRSEEWDQHTFQPASVEAVVNTWADALAAVLGERGRQNEQEHEEARVGGSRSANSPTGTTAPGNEAAPALRVDRFQLSEATREAIRENLKHRG